MNRQLWPLLPFRLPGSAWAFSSIFPIGVGEFELTTGSSFLELVSVQKSFGQTLVVKDFSLTVEKGEFISFLGPSGCGKTTLLRMIAGFETTSAGAIRMAGVDVTGKPPRERQIGMVFQAYALFPAMNVFDNIAFGLKIAKWNRRQIADRVAEMLSLTQLEGLSHRFPFELSGGQQQRVALARALALRPQILLLDEPLSALDAKIRVSLREEIRQLQRKLGLTTIFVTHDQEEALSMSDRIVVLDKGRAEQIATPHQLYNAPASPFIAEFVGKLNRLTMVRGAPHTGELDFDGLKVTANSSLHGGHEGARLIFGLRPEAIAFGEGPAGANRLSAIVEDVDFLGSILRLKLRVGNEILFMDQFNNRRNLIPERQAQVEVYFMPEDLMLLDESAGTA
ncbi:MAG: ABC transporter ATP-binding protein [Hyphomicrobiales bacterium]|nr:ABC transporter ATP-binding protein [Hyphomicrobiales bacterium]MDE2113379.1 ABC transporter ATP-binding protein [Hyphomicrobiales bacterium]